MHELKTQLHKEQTQDGHVSQKGLFLTRDKTSIYYEVQGEGRPLLLCYGLTCRRDHWRHQIRHFSKRYQIVTFDYRGHHASSLPPNDRHMTVEWCARDIEDLMSHLKLSDVVCLGHSMGVAVLTHAAIQLKEKMKGMVFVAGSVHNPFQHMFYTDKVNHLYRASAFMFEYFPKGSSRVWRQFTGRNPLSYFLTSQFGFNPDTSEEADILSYIEGVHHTPLQVFHQLMKDYTEVDRRNLLSQIETPTLVIAGDDDCLTPIAVQREVAELLLHGEFVVVPRGSHNTHTDFPHDVNRRIEDFLSHLGYE